MKDYDKNNGYLYLKYWDVNNLYGRVMSQWLFVDCCKWVGNTYWFSKYFIENCNKDSNG